MATLLEREDAQAALDRVLARATAGSGRIAVISGEAGIGKTSLARAFVLGRPGGRVLLGACDDLATPRPLGAIHDLSLRAGDALRDALRESPGGTSDREAVLGALFDELATPPAPVVVLIEDIHWADEATLDVLTFVARRIELLSALLVMTLRDTETDANPRLAQFLGTLPPAVTVRVPLAPLSEAAVATLARERALSAERVFAATGGNPFYVTEMLAARSEGIPATVREAVQARIARLPEECRALLELMSVVPNRAETWLLDHCQPGWTEAVEPAERRGMVALEDGALRFRHELARRAVEATLPAARALQLHRRALMALIEHDASPARIVHHAEHADNEDALVEYGPRAARAANAVSAHREAEAQYRRTLRYAERFPPEERAALWLEYAQVCYLTNRRDRATHAAAEAVRLRRELGTPVPVAAAMLVEARMRWWAGHSTDAIAETEEAIALLKPLERTGGTAETLARAYGARAQLAMLSRDSDALERYGALAIDLARELDDVSTLAPALSNVGIDRYVRGVDPEAALALEGVRLAREARLHDEVARGYMNLGYTSWVSRQYERAAAWLGEGERYAREHELLVNLAYMQATRAVIAVDRGEWDEALEIAAPLLSRPDAPITAFPALYSSCLVRTRRGDPDVDADVERLWEIAEGTGEFQRLVPAAIVRAEHAWQHDRLEDEVPLLTRVFDISRSGAVPRAVGVIALWLQRAGALEETPEEAERGYALQLAGRHAEAADWWRTTGCPYEEADALVWSDDPALMTEGLRVLDELGATPAAARARARMRRLGVHGVPRGPQTATRANPAGLTARQLDVLRLLAEGLTNAEIAERLVLSARTVDHHVAAILAKLEVENRREAARRAGELGLTADA